MPSYRRDLPTEGLARIDVELWRGSITVRTAAPGEEGFLESGWELEVGIDGHELHVRQPADVKRPLGLADLIGEQRVRIEVEGTVLLDREIRHGGGDVEIVLPSSVREVSCRTARGELRLDGLEAVADAYTGRGNVFLSGGQSRTAAGTAEGDIKVSGWLGPLHIRTGKGNVEVRSVHGDLDAKTGKGEIRIEEARAKVEAHTDHGNVVAGRLSGNAKLSTSHGDVVSTDLDGARLEASTIHGGIILGGRLAWSHVKTGHGDVVCRLDGAEGEHELHTGWGNINLDLHESLAARIDASTRRGRISSNLPLVKVGTSGPEGNFNQRMVGTTAGSGPVARINLNTKGGDIRIIRREAAPAASPVAPNRNVAATQIQSVSDQAYSSVTELPDPVEAAAVPQIETVLISTTEETASSGPPTRTTEPELEVLSALSRGELSVDEALILIEKIKAGGATTSRGTTS